MAEHELHGELEDEVASERGLVPLLPQEVRQVNFDGDRLMIGIVDGVAYVALKPIAKFLGVDWTAQYRRLKRDDILDEEKRLVVMTADDGKAYPMMSLPLEFLHGWLFTITGSRLKTKEAAEKHRHYRRDCFRVLWREFGEPTVVPGALNASALLQVRDMGLALVHMADEQMAMQGHLDAVTIRADEAHTRLDKAAEVVKGMQRRLVTVERRMLPHECISSEQATEVRLAVQRLGELLTRQETTQRKPGTKGTNFYSGIFTEIYNRTGAPRYELIRVEHYADVMHFLESWWQAASGNPSDDASSGT